MNVSLALLIVDVQNDFCTGGSLAVQGAEEIIDTINGYIELFTGLRLPIFASRDWHPADSRHFVTNGGSWPPHCLQHTPGARFHPRLRLFSTTVVISKGTTPGVDGYSVFQGTDIKGVSFEQLLRRLKINELTVIGLATDYCVKATVLEALEKGFKVRIGLDAVRGVEHTRGDSAAAVRAMMNAGGHSVTLEMLSAEMKRLQVKKI